MSKLWLICIIGIIMFGSIGLMILGIITSVTDPTSIGKFGGMVIFVGGFIILLASIPMLDSGLRIIELTENMEKAN